MRPMGSGGAGASAVNANYARHNWRALLDNVQATLGLSPHCLRRAALHLPLRRSERGPLYFHHGLLAPDAAYMVCVAFVVAEYVGAVEHDNPGAIGIGCKCR